MSGLKTSFLLFFALLALGSLASADDDVTELRLKADTEETSFKPNLKGAWLIEMGGKDFSEGKDQGAAAYVYFNAKIDWTFTSWLKAKIVPEVDLYSSRVQERYDNDDYQGGIFAPEAYLSLQPLDFAELRAGAINQGFLNDSMMVYAHRSFPGLQGLLTGKWNNYELKFVAEEVVPTSYSLNTEREDVEPLPFFSNQTLDLSGKNFGDWEWKASAGHFNWTDLPSKVAFLSSQLGNTTVGASEADSHFAYAFDGYFGGAEVCWCSDSRVQVTGEFQRIANTRAASGFGDAQMIGIQPRILIGQHELLIRYRHYFIERDATVAAYNRSFLGNNNREGDNVRISFDFKKEHFLVFGEWDNAVTIRDTPVQFTFTALRLGVETHYAPF